MIEVSKPTQAHQQAWETLYLGYAKFYKRPMDERILNTVWQWIHQADQEFRCLLAIDDGKPVGFAHYRLFPRPLMGNHGFYLDDLFVDPAQRRKGVGRKLIDHLSGIAKQENCSVIRWITASDNTQAQALYDQVAQATSWVTYDLNTTKPIS